MKIMGLEFGKEMSAKKGIPSKTISRQMFSFPIRHQKSAYLLASRFFL